VNRNLYVTSRVEADLVEADLKVRLYEISIDT